MQKLYHPYWLWEDYLNGMYNKSCENETDLIRKSELILSDQKLFADIIQKIQTEWKVSTAENMSNKNQNRRAWLGAAACNYYANTPEYVTRIAWANLTPIQQMEANKVADLFIIRYERENNGIRRNLGESLLF